MKNIYGDIDEIKLLKRSKLYIDAMALGMNPLTGESANDSVISNKKIQSCMEYVSFVLGKVIDKGGINNINNRVRNQNDKVVITREQVDKIRFSKEPIGISKLAQRINDVIDENVSKRVTGTMLANMMVDFGYIGYDEEKKKKAVNERSKELGITSIQRKRMYSDEIYTQILYSEDAQKFIAYHLIEDEK